jgi:MFS family permease
MIDRFMIPMMTFSAVELIVVSMVRVTTSYRAIELGLSAVWVGIITASFALLPLLLVLPLGRIIDRGHGVTIVRLGGAGLVIGSAGLWFDQSLFSLIAFAAVIGLAHLCMLIATQVLCASQPGPGAMERGLGNYMVSTAIGQGIGPAIIGWVGGSAAIPPIAQLFGIALVAAILGFAATFVLQSREVKTLSATDSKPTAIRDILAVPSFKPVLLISIVTVVSQDLVTVYLPLLANERGIAVDVVGSLLTVRAVAAVISRICYARLSLWLGGERLMWLSTFLSAVTYLSLAASLPLALMYVAIAVMGGGLGIAITVSIAMLLALAGTGSRGLANSLRSGGVRGGQVALPFAAGLLATAAGVASIFVVVGATLAASAAVAYFGRRR